MARLQITCADVVDNRVAKNIVARFFLRHALGIPAQHNAQLRLIIKAVDKPCIGRHLLARRRSTVHALRKINRIRTLAAKGLVRKTACLLRMSIVVDAQADNVLQRTHDGRQKLHLIDSDGCSLQRVRIRRQTCERCLHLIIIAKNQRVHIAERQLRRQSCQQLQTIGRASLLKADENLRLLID